MINAHFLLGYPEDFNGICQVYSPKVKDILSNIDYPVYRKLLLSSQEDLEDEYAELKLPMSEVPTPLQYLFVMSQADEKIKPVVIKAFEFFIHEPVTMVEDKNISPVNTMHYL